MTDFFPESMSADKSKPVDMFQAVEDDISQKTVMGTGSDFLSFI